GKMASLKGTDIVAVEMASAVDSLKTVPLDRWEEAQVLFG
ncbi:6-phosphofructokinase, partial [Burkholderia multivorans]